MFFIKRSSIIVLSILLFTTALCANPTKPVIDGGSNPIKGWSRDGNGKIKINVWLDSLNAEQKRVFKLAMDQWINWKTADTSLSESNYGKKNKDVMTGEDQAPGQSGRNLSGTDVNGMEQLYKDTSIEVSYVNTEAESNYKVYLTNETSFGDGRWFETTGDDYIDRGQVQIVKDLPPGYSWYYVKDSDGDGKITNKDTDGTQLISHYGSKYDYYSLVKHEIGHTLGFLHSEIVPAPSAMFLALIGTLAASKIRKHP